jgi:hypothetical protein
MLGLAATPRADVRRWELTVLPNGNLKGGTRIFLVLMAFTGVTSLGSRAAAQDSATNVAIERDAIGDSPRGFDLPQGQWTVVDDATAAAGVAIQQSSVRTTGDGFRLAIYRPALVENAEVSVRLNPARGTSEQGGGLAIRLSSPGNYYLAELDALRNRVLFSLVRNGVRAEIIAVDADIGSHTWHTLTVRAMGDEFVVSLDGTWMFTGFDKTLSQPGHIALWTKGDSITRFDSMAIARLRKPEQAYR